MTRAFVLSRNPDGTPICAFIGGYPVRELRVFAGRGDAVSAYAEACAWFGYEQHEPDAPPIAVDPDDAYLVRVAESLRAMRVDPDFDARMPD